MLHNHNSDNTTEAISLQIYGACGILDSDSDNFKSELLIMTTYNTMTAIKHIHDTTPARWNIICYTKYAPKLRDLNNWLSWTVLFEQRFENVKGTVDVTVNMLVFQKKPKYVFTCKTFSFYVKLI